MNQVQKWGWDISWLESVPSVHLKWCQTSEQSELINANKDHIFIIISDSQKWRKIVLASDWPRTRIDQNSKSLQILSLDLFLFSGTQRTQIYSINSLELITWYQKQSRVIVINFEWIALQNFDQNFRENCLISLKIQIISKIGRFWRENVLIPSF